MDNIDNMLMVFESSPDFSDNSRAFWEYVTSHSNYRTFWVIEDEKVLNLLQRNGIQCALKGTELANKMIDKAKFLITSSFYFAYSKRIGQIHISLWHGFPLKVIGFFDTATDNLDNFENLKILTTQTDLLVCTSRFSRLTLSGMLLIDPHKIKEIGYPRNDLLYSSNAKTELKKILDIDVDKSKLIFYLPTMRKGLKNEGLSFQNNIFNYSDYNVEALDKFLEQNDAYIIAKVHFADNKYYQENNFIFPKRLIFIDSNTMTNELLTIYHIMDAFDVLITDYSSVYVDFLLLNKPILFSCPDLEKYKNDRGFIVDDPTVLMPGCLVNTQSSLISNLDLLFNGIDLYKDVREQNISFFHKYKDSNSSERLFKQLELINNSSINVLDIEKSTTHLWCDKDSPLSQYNVKNQTAELFYGDEFVFSEECKLSKQYIMNLIHSTDIELKFFIKKDFNSLRIDPNINGGIILYNFSLLVNDHMVKECQIHGGTKINNFYIFDQQDPQIVFELDKIKNAEVKINFSVLSLYSKEGYDLAKSFEKTNKLYDIIKRRIKNR